jgi:hypothetical protein
MSENACWGYCHHSWVFVQLRCLPETADVTLVHQEFREHDDARRQMLTGARRWLVDSPNVADQGDGHSGWWQHRLRNGKIGEAVFDLHLSVPH